MPDKVTWRLVKQGDIIRFVYNNETRTVLVLDPSKPLKRKKDGIQVKLIESLQLPPGDYNDMEDSDIENIINKGAEYKTFSYGKARRVSVYTVGEVGHELMQKLESKRKK